MVNTLKRISPFYILSLIQLSNIPGKLLYLGSEPIYKIPTVILECIDEIALFLISGNPCYILPISRRML